MMFNKKQKGTPTNHPDYNTEEERKLAEDALLIQIFNMNDITTMYSNVIHVNVPTKFDAYQIVAIIESVCELEIISGIEIIGELDNVLIIEKTYGWGENRDTSSDELFVINIKGENNE